MARPRTPRQEARVIRNRKKRIKKLQVTALDKTLIELKSLVIRRHLKGPTSATTIRRQSGELIKSIQLGKAVAGRGRKGGAVAVFKFTSKYAKIHIGKRGRSTTIRPRRAKMLAIPTKFARARNGRPLGPPRDPRWGQTFVKNNTIFGIRAGTKRPRPLFQLRKSVVVPQRVDVKQDIVQPGQTIYRRKIEEGLRRILK